MNFSTFAFFAIFAILLTVCHQQQVQAVSVLGGKFDFTHDWISSTVLEINISAPVASAADKYYAISVQASGVSSGMSGSGIYAVSMTASATSTTASGLTTSSFNAVSRSESSLSVVSASADSTTAKMVLRVNPANIGVTASGTRNVLVAYGSYSAGSLTKHASDRARISVTFTNPDGSTPSPSGAAGYFVSSLVGAICVALFVFVL